MKIKSDVYFGKNIRFTCEVCGCVYDVESRDDWKINLVNMQIQEDSRISFKKFQIIVSSVQNANMKSVWDMIHQMFRI